jgi:hypothetical protein
MVLSGIFDLPQGMITRKVERTGTLWLLEGLLIIPILGHLITATKLRNQWQGKVISTSHWLQLFTGFYGTIFLLIHLVCISAGRLISGEETGFYTGAAGMNTDPLRIVFLIYGLLFATFFSGQFLCNCYNRLLQFLSVPADNKPELRA